MTNEKTWYKAKKQERKEITDFLISMNDETPIPLNSIKGGIESFLDIWEKENNGEILCSKIDNKIIGISQYTFGEPENNYQNKETGFLKLTIINPKYRNDTKRTIQLFSKYVEEFSSANFTSIKWTSLKHNNDYINKLYKKFAKVTGECLNSQQQPGYVWETTVEKLDKKIKKYSKFIK